jgi:hypothetical protein
VRLERRAQRSTGALLWIAVAAVAGALASLAWSGALAAPGYALQLDGVDDEARGGTIAGTGGRQTVEVWVRPARIGFSLILANSDDVTGWLLEMDQNGYVKFWAADAGGVWRAATHFGVPLRADVWQHVAATYDGARAQVYVDGVPGGEHDLGTIGQGPFFRIGGLRPYPFYAGQLDEVRISSGLRYSGNFTPPTTTFTPDASTLALYHLDEAGGQVIADASGHGRDLARGTGSAAEAADPAWLPSTAPLPGPAGGATPTATPPATPTSTPTVGPSTGRQHLPLAPRGGGTA